MHLYMPFFLGSVQDPSQVCVTKIFMMSKQIFLTTGGTTRGSGHTAVSTYDADEVPRSNGSNGTGGMGGGLGNGNGGGVGGRAQNGGRNGNGRAAYNEKTMLLSSDDEFQ